MEQELLIDEDVSSFVEDKAKDTDLDPKTGSVVGFVQERFQRSKDARRTHEERWGNCYRNYRGIYHPDMQFRDSENSRVFVKVTKTKVLAAYGQITEVLFGNNRFPLSINPTRLPDGVAETVYLDTNPNQPPAQEEAPDTNLRPGETLIDLRERLGAMKKTLEPVKDKLKEGPGSGPTEVPFYPAEVSAKRMEKKIHDQLEESGAKKQLRSAAFECALFGTGVMKGPFAVNKEYPNWKEDGTYDPLEKTVPHTSYVSVWNFYPDPDAINMDDAEFVIERHKMSRTQLRSLKRRPFFRDNAIDLAISYGEDYILEPWELSMDSNQQNSTVERFEVLEFWGFVDTELLKNHEVEIPEEIASKDQVSVNIWVCNGQVLRLVMNPFKPSYLPYYAVPYEINPYSMFGVGIAENMEDTQLLMNGFMRLAVDNAAFSGNMIFEVDKQGLVPGSNMELYPGKVFERDSGAVGQAIFAHKFPNVSSENMLLFDKARALSDESTGFPSFAHGQTGITGVGRTASGISMLMSAANGSIRAVIKNFDDYLLGPLGKGLFHFNMQFNFEPEIKGDLEVRAEGTESLMANEVRSQRLMQFLGVVQNPVLAPFAKMDYIVREIAKSMDLDPDKVANSMGAAAIQAEILKKFQAPMPEMGAPGAPSVNDTQGSGGGNIGTGSVPTPGEQGFSGNLEGALTNYLQSGGQGNPELDAAVMQALRGGSGGQ